MALAENGPILIVGASARAAAESAVTAGFRVTAIDMFGDADLRRICEVHVPRRWPQDVARLAAELPPQPWMYTGALENWPTIIRRISARHEPRGNDEQTVRGVRDAVSLAKTVTAAGFRMPETVAELPAGGAAGKGWLLKPVRSAGGFGIRHWKGDAAGLKDAEQTGRRHLWQREIRDGVSLGAVFVGDGSSAELWGVTRQLLDDPDFGSLRGGAAGEHAFHYCGSIGPVELPVAAHEQIAGLGRFLAGEFRLRGIFGLDLVLVRDEPWLIEINPRFTASVEVLEQATGRNAMERQLIRCGASAMRSSSSDTDERLTIGKAILFARQDTVLTDADLRYLLRCAKAVNGAWPAAVGLQEGEPEDCALDQCSQVVLSDIPAEAGPVPAGRPLFTLLTAEAGRGTSAEGACQAKLRTTAAELRARFKC